MVKKLNYLIGYGERLTEPIPAPLKGGEKAHPYTFDEARKRVARQLVKTVKELDSLPPEACPHDQAVALITVHPAYLAKSYYPNDLFTAIGVHSIGSRQREIKPEKW